MIDNPIKGSSLLWQSCSEDNVPEPPILIEPYYGTVSISQGENGSVLINHESIPELIKELKRIVKESNPK